MRGRRDRPSIAIIDTAAVEAYPSGKCSRAVAAAASADGYDVTVFSLAFDDPGEGRIRFVRVRAMPRPNVVLLPTFLVAVAIAFAWRRLRGDRYDAVITVEGYAIMGNVRYAHYCHAVHWDHLEPARGVRGVAQRLTTAMHRAMERFAYQRAERVVAVSQGLADELTQQYPRLAGRVFVIPNFVDVSTLERPNDTNERDRIRAGVGVPPDGRLLVFVALGHFERKGLPEVLDALGGLQDAARSSLWLVVVGGFPDRVRQMTMLAERHGVAERVRFVGMVSDARPYYWAADAFVMPSRYETFSFVAFEAAGSGLPLVATPVHGVCDILTDGVTGWQVGTDAASIRAALTDVAQCGAGEVRARGEKARAAVQAFDRDRFEGRWLGLLREVCGRGPGG